MAAALVGHAGRPDLVREEGREQRQRREPRGVLGDVLAHGLRGALREPAPQGSQRVALAQLAHDRRGVRVDRSETRLRSAAQPDEPPAAWNERAHQYVSLPPEWSKAAPVENVMRSLAR